MAIISDDGILSTSLAEYKTLLQDAFLSVLGADLDLDAQTPQGQMIGIIALSFSILDDLIVQCFQQLNIYNSAGNQLDSFGQLFQIARTPATYSICTATVTGTPSTLIPAGSRAKTTEGDYFESTGNITIDSLGSGSGTFQAVESGVVEIDADSLTQIVDVIAGWDTINNDDAGIVGTTEQSDYAYRNAYFDLIYQNSTGTIDSILSQIKALSDVEACVVFQNTSDYNLIIQEVTLLPHSVAVIVDGGDSQEIGDAIYNAKSGGCNTAGGDIGIQTAVTVDTNGGLSTETVYYYPVEFVTLTIDIEIVLYDPTADVQQSIKDAIIDFFAGTLNSTDEPISISDSSYLSRLYTAINTVSGFYVTNLSQEIEGSGNPQSVVIPNLNQQLVVTEDSISVTIGS